MMKLNVTLVALAGWLPALLGAGEAVGPRTPETLTPAPLYRDPVFDGAADPVLVWHPKRTCVESPQAPMRPLPQRQCRLI